MRRRKNGKVMKPPVPKNSFQDSHSLPGELLRKIVHCLRGMDILFNPGHDQKLSIANPLILQSFSRHQATVNFFFCNVRGQAQSCAVKIFMPVLKTSTITEAELCPLTIAFQNRPLSAIRRTSFTAEFLLTNRNSRFGWIENLLINKVIHPTN